MSNIVFIKPIEKLTKSKALIKIAKDNGIYKLKDFEKHGISELTFIFKKDIWIIRKILLTNKLPRTIDFMSLSSDIIIKLKAVKIESLNDLLKARRFVLNLFKDDENHLNDIKYLFSLYGINI